LVFGLLTGVVYKERWGVDLEEIGWFLLCILCLHILEFLKKLKQQFFLYIIYSIKERKITILTG